MPTPATPTDAMSWFMVCGRGDILKEDLEEMLAQDKDIDETDDEGLSGMMWAAFYGQIHTVQIFLECGVEVDRQGIWGETALMLAATEGHLEIVRMLIQAGANVNHEDHAHATPLMCAVYNDHPHTVHELLVNGADVTVLNAGNGTAHSIAVKMKSFKAKTVLEKYILSLIEKSIT
uniref:Uncharacterized protein n=2 Tax=Homalodisca TaxID=139475 RepID=A0A1B6JLS5_9HEMI